MDLSVIQKLLLITFICATFWLGWYLLWRKLRRIEAVLRKLHATIHFEAEKTRSHASNLFASPAHPPQSRQPRHLRIVTHNGTGSET